jgi:hypothetical protein
MANRMKITIELPDDLVMAAKKRAAELRQPLRKLLEDGLRQQLENPRQQARIGQEIPLGARRGRTSARCEHRGSLGNARMVAATIVIEPRSNTIFSIHINLHVGKLPQTTVERRDGPLFN